MKTFFRISLLFSATALLGAVLGCERTQTAASAPAPQPPEIPVARVEPQTAPDALGFSGRLEAMHHVELRPRVSGSVVAVRFQEGGLVRAGAVLFEIDPRPYRARRDQSAAEFARTNAVLVLAHQELARARRLRETDAISAEELERRTAEVAAAEASRGSAQAALAATELDVEFTTVRAPVDGRMGRALVTPGNFAGADRTVLATLISAEPMRVRFAIDEPAFQRLLASPHHTAWEARVAVPGIERSFAAKVDYLGNTVDTATGTVEVRATLANADTPLIDGTFARVELLLPATPGRVLAPETALGAEQGSRYVLVADAENKLVHRRVAIGPRLGNQRAITHGIAPGEFIVTAGLQFLRPGMTVRPVRSQSGETLAHRSVP